MDDIAQQLTSVWSAAVADRVCRTRDLAETPDGQRAPGRRGRPRCPQVSQRW